jgi:Putative bacterial sensory transduction regulator
VPGRLSRIAAAAVAAALGNQQRGNQQRGSKQRANQHRGNQHRGSQHRFDQPPIGRPEGPRVLPRTEVLRDILREYQLRWVVDDDGDLAVRWESYSIYFFHYGQDEEVLQARLYLNRRFEVELRPTLALVLDDWNRSKLFPKAYTVLPDDGLVGICAEQAFDFEGGISREQLKFTVGMWLQNLQQFADWTEEHI